MTLDLDELTAGWECPPGELRARVVMGRDGHELVQLRIDLGVMQMWPEGRPDGARYHGLPTVRAYIEHELRVCGGTLAAEDWQALGRELLQTNYRRMAYAALAEDALRANDEAAARCYLERTLSDIESCLADLGLLRDRSPGGNQDRGHLWPVLVFERARVLVQLRIVEGRFEEAIEEAGAGAAALDATLSEMGCEAEQREEDPGLNYLRNLSVQLRQEYGITRTLREQLADAVENEDFEAAAELRDELRRRQQSPHQAGESHSTG